MALLLAAGCAPGAEVPDVPVESAVPGIRVALATGATALTIGGGDALQVVGPDGVPIAELPVGSTAVLSRRGDRVEYQGAGMASAALALRIRPADPEGLIRLGGSDYRGDLAVATHPQGLLAVNRLDVEAYLAGVVNAEMGRRSAAEAAALEAQAIVSRTFALRAIGRWRAREYDVLATVADQAYGGVAAETAQGREAVRVSRGMVLTFDGQPVEAFFHSTCGGRTASGEEVFAAGGLPYLRSVSDAGPDGVSWCAISPRYRWSEAWTAEALGSVVSRALAEAGGRGPREIRDMVVTARTPSGRVQALGIETDQGTVSVTGPAIRRTLQPASGQLLRSAAFELQVTRQGGRLVRLTAEGQGAGHGVGLCQWGAVGRARAGATAAAILSAYFAGARIERRW